jgi:hypothetical protein
MVSVRGSCIAHLSNQPLESCLSSAACPAPGAKVMQAALLGTVSRLSQVHLSMGHSASHCCRSRTRRRSPAAAPLHSSAHCELGGGGGAEAAAAASASTSTFHSAASRLSAFRLNVPAAQPTAGNYPSSYAMLTTLLACCQQKGLALLVLWCGAWPQRSDAT